MPESFGRTLMYSIGGIVIGSVIGPLVAYLGQSGMVKVNLYGPIGFGLIVGALVCGILGVISNGWTGLITGLGVGGVLGGFIDYFFHPRLDIVGGWLLGAGLGLVGGLIAALLAPPEGYRRN
jgi:hypothetical protein